MTSTALAPAFLLIKWNTNYNYLQTACIGEGGKRERNIQTREEERWVNEPIGLDGVTLSMHEASVYYWCHSTQHSCLLGKTLRRKGEKEKCYYIVQFCKRLFHEVSIFLYSSKWFQKGKKVKMYTEKQEDIKVCYMHQVEDFYLLPH